MGLMNRLRNLTLHLTSVDNDYRRIYDELDQHSREIDIALLAAVIATASSQLNSFKLSGFEMLMKDNRLPPHLQLTPNFLAKEAPFLGNVSLAKVDFDAGLKLGVTVSKPLRMKL
ncbi:uncharacterized protein LOC118436632 [Folsomia candida]|uniref:uncharacterized protein LOC118436632 n=1 Tax=Folsomia candida TaxID=158441 RepID=UPI001605055F|nr:uncharacterized protein LOC118436632 [Folsomia candida]